jgi:serine/threonine-protein kinase
MPADSRTDPSAPRELPDRFDRYRIEALVGEGGMGRVYRAYDTRLRRAVALKVLRSDREGGRPAALLREARAAAALRHPNIVAVYDAGEVDGVAFLTMEWLEGAPLRAFVGDARVPLAERLRWLAEIAAALAAAHAAGLVHRDVKPGNVMVGTDRIARVLDFGLARSPSDETGATTRDAATPPAMVRVAGTPRYMAPEQLAGAPPAPPADQYAWGLVAYELCAGVHPAEVTGTVSNAERARAGPLPPLDEVSPEVPLPVAAIILRALDKRPLARHPDMNAIVRALAPWTSPGAAAGSAFGDSAALVPAGDDTVRDARPGEAASDETLSTQRALAGSVPPAPGRARGRTIAALAGGGVCLIALGGAVIALVLRAEPPMPEAVLPKPTAASAKPGPHVRRPPGRLRDLTSAALRDRVLAEGWEVSQERLVKPEGAWIYTVMAGKPFKNVSVVLAWEPRESLAVDIEKLYRQVNGAAVIRDGNSVLMVSAGLGGDEPAKQLLTALSRP